MAANAIYDTYQPPNKSSLQYALMRVTLKSVGRLSEGIRLGWRTGFDSGVMLEYVYQNQPRGNTPLGRLIDRQFLAHPVWDGVRSRRQFLIGQLNEAIERYEQPVVFDTAAGMGSYLFEVAPGQATIIAGDFEPEAVRRGQEKANRLHRQDIVFLESNAFIPERLAAQKADILVSSGFFDILNQDEQIQTVLRNGSAITGEGARWVFTIQEHHPDLSLLKESLIDLHKEPWELIPRPASLLVKWAAPYGWELETLQRNEYFAVGTLVRTTVKNPEQ